MRKTLDSLLNTWYGGKENCVVLSDSTQDGGLYILGVSQGVIDIAYIFSINNILDIDIDYRLESANKIKLMKNYIETKSLYEALEDSLKYELLYQICKCSNNRNIKLTKDYEEITTLLIGKLI